MFSRKWRTSERKYNVVVEYDVAIPMRNGINIICDVFRPNDGGKFPAILSESCYGKALQSAPIMPAGMDMKNAAAEAGDPYFYGRRGYLHVIADVRGSGKSGGKYTNYGLQEQKDTYEIIEWIANHPRCDGNVTMFGFSYFSIVQQQVAALNPPHLKTIFSPYAYTDFYRDKFYHGGILSYGFMLAWTGLFSHARVDSWSLRNMTPEAYEEAIDRMLQDEDVRAVPQLVEALKNPDVGANPLIADILINRFDGPYYQERNIKYEDIKIPTYLGSDWSLYGLEGVGPATRSWENINAPKRMIIGPPYYTDRPLYQYQYESLRWFDYWLKGINTGIMEESPIKIFVMGANEWKQTDDWPLPETKWTPFYLHENGLLSEHEFWPNEGCSSFDDSPMLSTRGSLKFISPPLVENTEVIGPIILNLYASTTDDEILWFVSLWDIDSKGKGRLVNDEGERLLTRGWLRGSQRQIDPERSKPYEPFHVHLKKEHLIPGKIYEFNIRIEPTGNLFKIGHRIGLKISAGDGEPPKSFLEGVFGTGHLLRQASSRITVYHNADYPSHLLLPITKGNVVGTFISGGKTSTLA